MTVNVRWPRPPYLLSRATASGPIIRLISSIVFGLTGALLIVVTFFLVFAWNADNPSTLTGRWLPTLVIFGVGVALSGAGYTLFRSVRGLKQVADAGKMGQIVEADILYSANFSRGGTYWVYAYSKDGRRFYDRRTGTDRRIPGGAPMFFDDVQTRGAVLVVEGAGEVVRGNFYPFKFDKTQRDAVEHDRVRLAGQPTAKTPGGLAVLEAQTPAGPARDYVHFFREACAVEGGQRHKMINRRDIAAAKLKLEELDDLLNDCRRHAAGLDQGFGDLGAGRPLGQLA
jgi:hypothetical protein